MDLRSKFFKCEHGRGNHMTQGVDKQIGSLATVEAERDFLQVGLQVLRADSMPRSNVEHGLLFDRSPNLAQLNQR